MESLVLRLRGGNPDWVPFDQSSKQEKRWWWFVKCLQGKHGKRKRLAWEEPEDEVLQCQLRRSFRRQYLEELRAARLRRILLWIGHARCWLNTLD